MAFNPATSYTGDYAYQDFVEDASWEYPSGDETETVTGLKAQLGDIDTPDLVSAATGLGLSSNAAPIVVWQADADKDFDPKPGHVLRLTDSGGWVMKSIHRSSFGDWAILCDKEVENVG